jgi:hypothetical protein
MKSIKKVIACEWKYLVSEDVQVTEYNLIPTNSIDIDVKDID